MARHAPNPQGLYDSRNEHDACGVNFVCDLKGRPSHRIVELGIGALCNLEHRGASGAEVNTGDGAGILIQIPDEFYRATVDFELPPSRHYGTGIAFLPQSEVEARQAVIEIERIAADEGLQILGWRDVPVDSSPLGTGALGTMPRFGQLFVAAADASITHRQLDRRLYILRKRLEHEIRLAAGPDEINEAMGGMSEAHDGVYFPSLSAYTVVYKGMLTTPQLAQFYPDLVDERVTSALALVHSRFSTNTFPSWPLAHPYRFVAHNGEINTIQGNRNWMRARETMLATDLLPGDLDRLFPICTPGASDTAGFDEALELLYMGGYSLLEAVLMMIPEPWENHDSMSNDRRAFYEFHASMMEPWDGPASIAFTDGEVIGAVLDRNGLRPSRYWVTDDDLVIMASEVGVVEVPQSSVIEKGRLQPGRVFFIDTTEGRIVRDNEIKSGLASARPYQQWLDQNLVHLDDLPPRERLLDDEGNTVQRQQLFGYTHEELKILVAPMAKEGKEAIGSMGTDTPIAVLSDRSRNIYDYFHQLFAQVTNPPLDAIREELVTAVNTTLGPEQNLFAPGPQSCRQLKIPHPVLTKEQLAALIGIDGPGGIKDFSAAVIDCRYPVSEGGEGLARSIESVRAQASQAVEHGASILVLSDRGTTDQLAPIPSLLITGAVHHHLIREKTRTQVGIVVESGDMREVHHLSLLLGYGADAVCPYLAFDSIDAMLVDSLHGLSGIDRVTAHQNYIKAC
ncbi:MAG: glutamate synthase subunit alpha, partial [Acidimicrobiia bacterium]|nr:glutamate synthase subunit alpha [Acidimicrobiia bacterium]